MMKIKNMRLFALAIATGGLGLLSGCVVGPNGQVVGVWPFVVVAPQPVVYAAPPPAVYAAPPPVVYAAPPPVVYAGPVMVPDSYVWDGYEYVGLVGDQYYYLGPGNVWLFCDSVRLERFHGWEGSHQDWRNHVTRNDHYRTDRNGHVQPRHDGEKG